VLFDNSIVIDVATAHGGGNPKCDDRCHGTVRWIPAPAGMTKESRRSALNAKNVRIA
jgi:hypothetical protein